MSLRHNSLILLVLLLAFAVGCQGQQPPATPTGANSNSTISKATSDKSDDSKSTGKNNSTTPDAVAEAKTDYSANLKQVADLTAKHDFEAARRQLDELDTQAANLSAEQVKRLAELKDEFEEQQQVHEDQTRERLLAAARDFIVKAQMTDAERTAALAMVAKLQAQARAAGGNWPADLFRPASGEHQESRELPLPDGSTGKVTVTITATDAPGGLLDRLQRRVVTELGGSARLSTETWTLASLP